MSEVKPRAGGACFHLVWNISGDGTGCLGVPAPRSHPEAALTIDIPSNGDLRSVLTRVGWAAPVLCAAAYAALVLTPLPATITTITAGLLFGLPIGLAVSMTGAVVGASIGFGLARVLGHDAVELLDSDRLHRLDELLRRRGLLAVIGVRLVTRRRRTVAAEPPA